MAYWIDPKSDMKSNCKTFMCDYRADIQDLPRMGVHGKEQDGDSISDNPCLYGSSCLCYEDSSLWMLGKDTNTWKEL